METMIQLAWAVIPGVIVGIVLAFWTRKQKKKDELDKQVAESRKKQDLLNLNLTVAAAKLSYATAVAVKRGYANGEVEKGVSAYDKAIKEYEAFEREQTIESLAV